MRNPENFFGDFKHYWVLKADLALSLQSENCACMQNCASTEKNRLLIAWSCRTFCMKK
jgi:hypothetical protein